MGFRNSRFFLTTTAIVTRVLFVIYSLLLVWHIYRNKNDEPLWWLLVFSVIPMLGELLIVICVNKGREWNSVFCPGFFIFLVTVIPQLWLVEVTRIDSIQRNITDASTTLSIDFGMVEDPLLTISLSDETWALALKESLLYILIAARWLLPIQHLTYAQLSDTLLLYIGMAADLMELMDLSHNQAAIQDWNFVYALLAVWSFSLFQFTYVLVPSDDDDEDENEHITCSCSTVHSEVLGTLLNLVMMYIPFATIRVVAIVFYSGQSYSSVFFLVKNMMMIVLSTNRLIVLFCQRGKRRAEREAAKNEKNNQELAIKSHGEKEDTASDQKTDEEDIYVNVS